MHKKPYLVYIFAIFTNNILLYIFAIFTNNIWSYLIRPSVILLIIRTRLFARMHNLRESKTPHGSRRRKPVAPFYVFFVSHFVRRPLYTRLDLHRPPSLLSPPSSFSAATLIVFCPMALQNVLSFWHMKIREESTRIFFFWYMRREERTRTEMKMTGGVYTNASYCITGGHSKYDLR